jgi:hypothetical protein
MRGYCSGFVLEVTALSPLRIPSPPLKADELRTFDAGGKYADDNAAAYRRSLGAIDAHLARAGEEQAARLEAARAALAAEVSFLSGALRLLLQLRCGRARGGAGD